LECLAFGEHDGGSCASCAARAAYAVAHVLLCSKAFSVLKSLLGAQKPVLELQQTLLLLIKRIPPAYTYRTYMMSMHRTSPHLGGKCCVLNLSAGLPTPERPPMLCCCLPPHTTLTVPHSPGSLLAFPLSPLSLPAFPDPPSRRRARSLEGA